MMRLLKPVSGSLLLLVLAAPLCADSRELKTVKLSYGVLKVLTAPSVRDIPPVLVRDAAAVAIIPQVLRGGLLFGGRFGRGVMMVRQPDGTWADPVFVTLSGGSVGGQVGIEASDLVLVFRHRQAVEQALAGSFSLDGGVAVAVGPLASQAEKAAWQQAEVLCFPQSRGGLFVGVSLEGAWLRCDDRGTETFFRPRTRVEAADASAAVGLLKLELVKLGMPPPPVPVPPPPPRKRR
jgi:lipid-binding SYLF domain-containing protein